MANWETHCEQWLDFLAQHHNTMTVMPLTYVLCELADVPAEDLEKSYPTIDDDLIVTMKHIDPQFSIDNQCVIALYKQLIVDHPAWEYTKAHSKANDGCQAFLSVQCQATGTAAIMLKKKMVYNQLSTAKHNRHGCFTFQAYAHYHQ